MALTFTLGAASFSALSSSDGRKAMSIRIGSAQYDIRRFHPPGVNGNFLVRAGRVGQQIVANVRYVGTVSGVYGLFKADKDALENTAVTITAPEGSYSRCQLEPGGASITRDPVAMGRGGKVFMDCTFAFTRDS